MKAQEVIPMIRFVDAERRTLLQCKLTAVRLRESAILRLSEEYFRDPEPCMIHRSAVMSRMYQELLAYFQQGPQEDHGVFLFAQLPERLSSFLDIEHCHEIDVLNG